MSHNRTREREKLWIFGLAALTILVGVTLLQATILESRPAVPTAAVNASPRAHRREVAPQLTLTGFFPAAVPPAVAAAAPSLSDLFDRDDVCGLSDNIFGLRSSHWRADEDFHWLTLLRDRGRLANVDPARVALWEALTQSDPESARSLLQNATDETSRYYDALFEGGLLDGLTPKDPDPVRAVTLLEELRAGDPENGAYPFFIAALKARLGYADEARRELLAATQAPRFDTFAMGLAQDTLQLGKASPSETLISVHASSSLPGPDFTLATRLLQSELAREVDKELASSALDFADRLRTPGLDHARSPAMYTWSALEFAIGGAVGKTAWTKLHPDESLPERLTFKYWQLTGRGNPANEIDPTFHGPCQPEVLRANYQRLQSAVAEFLEAR